MLIHQNFIGGNISVKETDGNTVVLENELRDTTGDWFYWAFCVEGAENKTITFKFQQKRLGYFGPAVSYDLENWRWLNSVDGDSFTYKFNENENKVYFAYSMLYHPKRFFDFADKHNLRILYHSIYPMGRALSRDIIFPCQDREPSETTEKVIKNSNNTTDMV